MAAVTIRNIPDEIHRALKARATKHGRSTEAEIRQILADAVMSREQVGLGTALAEFGARYGGLDLDISRDQTPIEPADFE